MRKIILVLVVVTTLFACKNDKVKSKAQDDTELKKEDNTLKVFFEFKTNKEDEFKIILNNIEVDEFQKMNIEAREIIPVTTSFEKMNVSFFDNVFSKNFLIGLGNDKLKELEINKIVISRGPNIVTVNKENIQDYFSPNKYVEFKNNKIITKKVNGKHVPLLFAKSRLINTLKKK